MSLLVSGADFAADSWLSCTEVGCMVDTCPGRLMRDNDRESCPFNIFTFYKLAKGDYSQPDSSIIRVGDSVILEHKMATTLNNLGGAEPKLMSYFISCDPESLVCSLSLECTADTDKYNATSFCQENVLEVRVEGKEDGEPVTHRDLIGFEYKSNHDAFLSQQCAFGCNPVTKVCAKERCVFSGNSLSQISLPGETTRCGKDLFFVRKF